MARLNCPKCNSSIAKDDYSCPKCGAALYGELIYVEYKSGYAVAQPKDKHLRLAKIEPEYQGKPVVAILENAFTGCPDLISVLIPDSVTYIGEHAFEDCKKLETAVIPESVVEVGPYAYYGCESLSDLTIGNGLSKVSSSAACYCRNLTAMRYSTGLGSLGGGGNFTCICGALSFSSKMEIIGGYAFANCPLIKEVTLPEGLKEIREGAFSNCASLASIFLPVSLERIDAPFVESNSLKSIRFNGRKDILLKAYKKGPESSLHRVACMDGIVSI